MEYRGRVALSGVLALGAMLASVEGRADEARWYAGFTVGNTLWDTPETEHQYRELGIEPHFIDDTGRGWHLYLGRRLHRYIAVEVNYVSLGAFGIQGTQTTTTRVADIDTEFDVFGWSIEGVGRYPLGQRLTVFGKGGMWQWTKEGSGDVPAADTGDVFAPTSVERDLGLAYGLGLKYHFNRFSLRSDWHNYDFDSESATIFSLGVEFGLNW